MDKHLVSPLIEGLEPRRLMAVHPVAINFNDEAIGDSNYATALAQAKKLGVTAVRLWLGFDDVSARPKAWDTTKGTGGQVVKRAFQLAREGFSVMIIVNDRQGDAPSSPAGLKAFIRHLMDTTETTTSSVKLKDVVEYWEIGNEPDASHYWKESGASKVAGLKSYVDKFLIPAAEELNANGDNEKVVSAGPSYNPEDLRTILAQLQSRGKLDLLDFAGFHPYGIFDTRNPSVNQVRDRTNAAVAIGKLYGKKLIAPEWNIRGFGNDGSKNDYWVQAMDQAYRETILPNFEVAYYFALVNNWDARGGTTSARPGGLLKHNTSIKVTPTSPQASLDAYYKSPLIPAEPFYSTFNSWQYGSISGQVVAAQGSSGSSLRVYVDVNGDGSYQSTEPSATTDGGGLFSLQYSTRQVRTGQYALRVVPPSGWSSGASPILSLTSLAAATGVQLFVVPPGTTKTGSISGFLWNDTDGDGDFDSSESRAGSRVVFIDTNANNKLDSGEKSTTTDASGNYSFTGLAAGVYNLTRVFASGERISNSGTSWLTLSLAAGQALNGANIGSTTKSTSTTTGTIAGLHYNDVNGNGKQNANDLPIGGRTVFVDLNRNFSFDIGEPNAITDSSGNFKLVYNTAVHEPGSYPLRQRLPIGWGQTVGTPIVTLAAGKYESGLKIGSWLMPVTPPVNPTRTGTVSGTHWNDIDGDGFWDPNEKIVIGRQVFIDVNRNFQYDVGEPHTTTDSKGNFTIVYDTSKTAPGTYPLRQRLPEDWNQTVGTPPITVAAGRADSGYVIGSRLGVALTAAISGVAFADTNGNGARDAGEAAAPGDTVFIDSNGNKVLDSGERSTTTDSTGKYTFNNLAAGTYNITRVFASGYKFSNNSTGFLSLGLNAGQVLSGVDLGAVRTAPASTAKTSSIAGYLFNDVNGNGGLDASESRTASRVVYIDSNGNNKLDAGEVNTTSDGSGNYKFANLAAGTYRVSRVLPAGYKFTNPSAGYRLVTVANATAVTGIHFGTKQV